MDDKSSSARSRNMSRIHSRDTKPEIIVRKILFSLGYRFRLHRRDLPGVPDIVMPGRKIVIFVHGCFWHSHAGCRRAVTPKSRDSYWVPKLLRNAERDIKVRNELLAMGWRVLWIWECSLSTKAGRERLPDLLNAWIQSSDNFSEIPQKSQELI